VQGFLTKPLTRREAVRFLGAAAGSLLMGKSLSGWQKAPMAVTAGASNIGFPKGAVIRTILADMPPAALASGPVLFHEHLSLHLAGLEEHFTDDVALMIE